MAIQGGNEQGGIFAAINITPLTDIFLVLLIIFMVATAITIESAAHVDLPRLQTPDQKQRPKGVTVTYTADHQIYVNQKNVTESQLGPAIHDALSQTTDKVVVFDGDPKVILGDMVRILDVAKSSGAENIALAVSGGGEGSSAPAEMGPGSVPEIDNVAPGSEPEPGQVAPSDAP
jgi:biopolymer transport protein ExbD